MNTINSIQKLLSEQPEFPDAVVIGQIIKYFLDQPIQELMIKPNETLELLLELSDKQWHTYEPLNQSLLQNLDQIVLNFWDASSLKSTELLFGIVASFGLDGSYQFLKHNYQNLSLSDDISKEIASSINELGENVKNPYKSKPIE